MIDLQQFGLFGLFLASFLAATILPFSSEALLSVMIFSGYQTFDCIVVATFGNWLGGMSSYFLGYLGKVEWIEKYLKVKKEKTEKFNKTISRVGAYFAFFCWLPFVGDIIAVSLGLFRSNWLVVSIFMLLGKAIRYIVWSYFTLSLKWF